MDASLAEMIHRAIVWLPPLLFALVLHEIAHAWTAWKLGDPTAKSLNRLSLNPAVHLDPMMSLFVPGMLLFTGSPFIFGGAKPVPVNAYNFKNPRRGMLIVAAAGPIINIILAIIFNVLFLLTAESLLQHGNIGKLLVEWIGVSVQLNIILAAFNLIPIPPLDGGRILAGILPDSLAEKYEQIEPYGFIVIIALLFTGLLNYLLMPLLYLVASLTGVAF